MSGVTDESIAATARQVIEIESKAVASVASAIDERFEAAVHEIAGGRGALLASGVGKAGLIARKISATFASTGTPSHFLSPTDALHGDLGAVRAGDLILLLSASGESDEVARLLEILHGLGHRTIAITRDRLSTIGRNASITVATGKIDEACPLGLAPTATTTAMLALGDALAMAVMRQRRFTAEEFATYHPAGQLGRKLLRVSEAMTFRLGENLPVAPERQTVGEVLSAVSRIKRRSGGVILVDDERRLAGFFSDGDLRRLVQRDPAGAMTTPVGEVMSRNPRHIRGDALAAEAMAVMREHRIDELPVVDDERRPVGLIDVQDLVALRFL
jgi:arabinose-5-phosphate isomerase